jgi:lipopolysaccharide/colanic/teichoic acid biosynthesis glycosyltransferase
MRLDANDGSGVIRAVADDPRRLRIGEFMRKWNLDEIPQFWNVLRGEMSLVGPRPEILDLIAGLRGSLHGYNLRHLCKPGMTGWAAVNGLRGDTSLDERVKYDLYYIDRWSLMMDFRIMLLTLLPPKNAY